MSDIPASLKDWSVTEASNEPAGTRAIGNLDNNLRRIQVVIRELASSTTLASAATTDLGSVDESYVTVSGTTTITSLGSVSAGINRWVVFSGALTLTHNGSSLILPTAGSITTAAGDCAHFLSLGGGNWRCLAYQRADGSSLSNQTILPDGSVSTPALRFTSDTDTGLYRVGPNTMGFAAGGDQVLEIGAAGAIYKGGVSGSGVGVSANNGGVTFRIEANTTADARLIRDDNGSGGLPGPSIVMNYPSRSAGTDNWFTMSNSGGLAWRVNMSGATFADGAYSSSGADYAEGFHYVGTKPQPGDTVVLEGDKVRIAEPGEEPIGAVSERPSVVGDMKTIEAGGVAVGLVGKIRVNPGRPIGYRWKILKEDLYLVIP